MTDSLADLDPFRIFDTEAARLDRFFSGLSSAADWSRPTRCAGWSVRDVLGHLTGEELYNHACLDGDLQGLSAMLSREGVGEGLDGFNDWCVRRWRRYPVDSVLAEWRGRNGQTRERMRARGREALLPTMAGPYPVGMQTLHYASEYATHADDVAAPVSSEEVPARLRWRARFAMRVIGVDAIDDEISLDDFVAATVGRLPPEHPLSPERREKLRCLA